MIREAVLIIGASGNVGISVIIAALHSNLDVLAPVRNDKAKHKILHDLTYDPSLPVDRITFAEVDISQDDGVASIVARVEKGDLPAFQHVYSTVGLFLPDTPMYSLDLSDVRRTVLLGWEPAFLAYRATIPYLLSQSNPTTWTVVTGGAGDYGYAGVTAIGQGALYSFAASATRELADPNVRFNEVYLHTRVEPDLLVDAEPTWAAAGFVLKKTRASEFAKVYERILNKEEVRGGRVFFFGVQDLDVDEGLRWEKKLKDEQR